MKFDILRATPNEKKRSGILDSQLAVARFSFPMAHGPRAFIPPVSGFGHTPGFFLLPHGVSVSIRAMLFVDGNNWYHSLRENGLTGIGQLNYAKVSRKLCGQRRDWVGTRYYVGQVNQKHEPQLYADQRSFLARLTATDAKITHYLGRLEPRKVDNEAAKGLRQYLSSLKFRIDKTVFQDLMRLAREHESVEVITEKAVDVMLAVDAVLLAQRDEYDACYLLTADGDFTPVATAVRSLGKKVYAASPNQGAQLAAAVDTFIPPKTADKSSGGRDVVCVPT